MSQDPAALEAFAAHLIAALVPTARRALAKTIAGALRPSQAKRIAAQQNPDGSAYAPRKPQLRQQKGRLRRTMFAKLRTSKYLKASSTADEAIVTFAREVQRIAQVHHRGLRDRVDRKSGREADYPARELLGISADDEALIRDLVTAHLADRF